VRRKRRGQLIGRRAVSAHCVDWRTEPIPPLSAPTGLHFGSSARHGCARQGEKKPACALAYRGGHKTARSKAADKWRRNLVFCPPVSATSQVPRTLAEMPVRGPKRRYIGPGGTSPAMPSYSAHAYRATCPHTDSSSTRATHLTASCAIPRILMLLYQCNITPDTSEIDHAAAYRFAYPRTGPPGLRMMPDTLGSVLGRPARTDTGFACRR